MDRLQRVRAVARKKELDALLITAPGSVKCFSGYWYNFETGPSPFHILPAILLIQPENDLALLLADNEADKANTLLPGIISHIYPSYTYETPLQFEAGFYDEVRKILSPVRSKAPVRLGVELHSSPHGLYQVLAADHPRVELIDVTKEIQAVKAIKDADEVAFIRNAAHLADTGQAAVLQYAKPGMTELELFAKVRFQMENTAGTRVPVMTDLICGEATASGGGNPSNRIIREYDLVLSDLTPCLQGYWGDSCSTIIMGAPTAEQERIFRLVQEALEIGISTVRPGVKAKDVDHVMRHHLAGEGNFGHHGGHGVGTGYHEEPRIVPYNNNILEPGMVIALEPAIYKPSYGIRLEHLLLVTDNGCEVLTHFRHRFTSVQ